MASKAPKPTVRERLALRICPNCGGPVARTSARGPAPTFCEAKGKGVCKREMNNRLVVEGRAAIAFLKAWRIDRGQGPIAQASFAQLCEIADGFNAADLAANRPRADYYAATILVEGTRYFDRQRGPRAPRAEAEAAPIDQTAALRDKLADPATGDNERAVLAAALEILSAPQA